MADDKVGTGVHRAAREQDDVAARLAVILFLGERYVCCIGAFGAAVKRDDDDVVLLVECPEPRERRLVVEQHVGVFRHGAISRSKCLRALTLRYRRRASPLRSSPCLPRRSRAHGCWPG